MNITISIRKLSVLLALILSIHVPAFCQYSGGDGNEANPYKISNTQDWQKLMNTSPDWNKSFILIADINLADVNVTPIGNSTTNFTGIFDGNGHVISNIDINLPSANNVGLFGYLGSAGKIQKLGIMDANIIGNQSIAGLVGRNTGTILSCYSTGKVNGNSNVGGLAGYQTGTSSRIENSYSYASVNAVSYNAGGFIGSVNGGILSACYSSGLVSSSGSYVGGFVGPCSCIVTTCFWDIQTSGRTTSAGGKGLTTTQMKSIITYQNAGWAGKGWTINDGNDYPHLQWQSAIGIPIPLDVIPLTGTGTAEDPYQVWSSDDFVSLNRHFGILDKHIKLMADLDLKDVTIYPIAELATFCGVFDGNDKIISNVSINQPSASYVSLFGDVTSSQIKNLNLENITVTGGSYTAALASYVSGSSSLIENCSVTGKITGRSETGGLVTYNFGTMKNCHAEIIVIGSTYSGGLIGYNAGTLLNCSASGTVSGQGSTGGLIGSNYRGNVTKCSADIKVTGTATAAVGGLIGINHGGNVSSCHAAGDVKGNSDTGGLIGYNTKSSVSSYVSDCYATGNVVGTAASSNAVSVGGLIGTNEGSIVDTCYASGMISCLGYPISSSSNYGGGLVGKNSQGCIFNSFATGQISGTGSNGGLVGSNDTSSSDYPDSIIDHCYAAGNVSGYGDVGGLVASSGSQISKCKISASYALGSVTCNGSYRNGGTAGGLVGYNNSSIENCFASGPVSVASSSYSNFYTGGLVGYNFNANVKYSYAVGAVSGSNSYSGGLVGYGSVSATTCFWDTQTSGQSTSRAGTGKTTAQMKTLSTFTDAAWDFNKMWSMPVNNYPALKWSQNQANIGFGSDQWQLPLASYYSNARTQTIYLASELGRSCWITSLSLNVAKAPGQTLNNFTIRMKHTDLNVYPASPKPTWDDNDWQIVYQADRSITDVGWTKFDFTTPFDYNSAQNLMVDISFNNDSWSADGYCYYSTHGGLRSIFCQTDGEFGDPLNWSNRSPAPYVTENVPDLKLSLYDEKPSTPDFNGDYFVNVKDFAIFAADWNNSDSSAPFWSNGADLDKSGIVDCNDLALFASQWLANLDPTAMTWIDVNEIGIKGLVSKYETTNQQYCQFLNDAKAAGLISIYNNIVYAANDSTHSKPYYNLNGAGYNSNGALNGGASRINFDNDLFSVDSGFENHPVTFVSFFGADAFCNYYGYVLPSRYQWIAVADFDGTYQYGCGTTLNNSIANYSGSSHHDGTTTVGAFGLYGYGFADLAGNVFEWTSSPNGTTSFYIVGGSWQASDSYAKVSAISYKSWNIMSCDLGFRAYLLP